MRPSFLPCLLLAAACDLGDGPGPGGRPGGPDAAPSPTTPDAGTGGTGSCTPDTWTVDTGVMYSSRPVFMSDGTVVVLYTRKGTFFVLEASRRPGDAKWQIAPVPNSVQFAGRDSIGIDGQDGLHAMVYDAQWWLHYAYRPAGGDWQTVAVEQAEGDWVAIAPNPYGRAAVAYSVQSGNEKQLRLRWCEPGDFMTCYTPRQIQNGFDFSWPTLAIDADGGAIIGYTLFYSNGDSDAWVAHLNGTLTWPDTVASGKHDDGPVELAGGFVAYNQLDPRQVYVGELPITGGLTQELPAALVAQGVADTMGRVWWNVYDYGNVTKRFYLRRETSGSYTRLESIPANGNFGVDGAGRVHVFTISSDSSATLTETRACP